MPDTDYEREPMDVHTDLEAGRGPGCDLCGVEFFWSQRDYDDHVWSTHVPRNLPVMADKLAEAIRNHGPWMDDQCRAVLDEYDTLTRNQSGG